MDIKSPEKRSSNMKAIKSKNTKPEIYLRHLLFGKGYRYRLHVKSLPGTPDLYFKKFNTALFVNGCFWHRHQDCKLAYFPKSNQEFWQKKFTDNLERDARQKHDLEQKGIRILIVWECTIQSMMKNSEVSEIVLKKICEFFDNQQLQYMEL